MFPVPEFEGVHYKILNEKVVVFAPDEWRGTSGQVTRLRWALLFLLAALSSWSLLSSQLFFPSPSSSSFSK